MSQPVHNLASKMFANGQLLKFKKGELILQPTDEPESIFYISRGFVKIYSLNNHGEQYVHIIAVAGEIFPFLWIIKPEQRNLYYEALSPTQVFRLPRETVAELSRTNAEFTFEMLKQVIDQYRIYSDRVDNLEYKYASERLAYRLLFMASRFGVRKGSEVILQAPVTHQVLGSTINLSRESVTREMDKLIRRGVVEYRNRTIVLKDIDALKRQFKSPLSPSWWGLGAAPDKKE